MLNFDDKLVRIPMPIIATLAPSQDTTSDQLAAFYRQPGIPFTRHSPLPVAASAPTNALINSAKKLLVLLALLVCAGRASAATNPAVTVSASSISITGASQPISVTVNLIDPNNTGMLSVAGTGIVPIMRATSPTPGTTTTVGPVYGNDVILNGYGVANTTYYQVSVYTVNGGTIASTPSLQNFYAFTGSGTIDLSTATPLAPSFMSGPLGVTIPGNLAVGGTGTFYGALSALGGLTTTSLTIAGTTVLCQFNSVAYVGGSCAATWGDGDIGSQINAAYTTLPATGGEIILLPQTNGACYLYNTTITLSTIGKYAHLVGGANPQGTTGATAGGACLQYTHITATNAIVIDWDTTGNGTYIAHQAIDNIVLVNSSTEGGSTPCTSNQGCGSSATGLMIPGVNGGIQMGEFRNMTIKGFGTGMNWSNGPGWGSMCSNCSFAENTTGLVMTTGTEGVAFFGGNFSVNQTGVRIATGSSPTAMSFTGTHFDSNSVLALDGSSSSTLGCGTVSFNSVHFENNQQTNSHYVNCAGGLVAFHGVDASDDSASSNTDWWFTVQNAVGDLEVISAGRTVTNLFVVGSSTALTVYDNNPAALPFSTMGLCTATVDCADIITSPVATAFSYLSQINQSTNSPFSEVTTCSGNTKAVVFAVAYLFGAPTIQLTDYTTAGGLNITAGPSKTGFTVHCSGATDTFSWTAIGNPY